MPRQFCLLLFLPLACALSLTGKTFVAERYDVRVRVQPDATLSVAENVRFRFEGGRFSYVTREVWKRGADRIYDLDTAMDGVPVRTDVEENGRRIKVVWHFDAPAGSVHQFTLTYRVDGAISREPNRDALLWHAIPDRHDYTILAGEVAVEYPEGAIAGPVEAPRAVETQRENGRTVFTLPQLAPDQEAPVRAYFRPGFAPRPPAWQTADRLRGERTATAVTAGLCGGLIALALGGFWLMRLNESLPAHAESRGAPADAGDLAPAAAARLAGNQSGVYAGFGTIFDLARRGVVAFRQGDQRLSRRKKYQVELRDPAAPLLPFERAVLDLAAPGGSPYQPRDFSAFTKSLSAHSSRITRPLEQHMVSLGLLDPRRKAVRKGLYTKGLLLLLGGLAVAAGGAVLSTAALETASNAGTTAVAVVTGLGAAAFFVGIAFLIRASYVSVLSAKGAARAAYWRGVRSKLRAMAAGKSEAVPADFERWLPFVMAAGFGTQWVRRFRKENDIPPPAWLKAYDGAALDSVGFYDFVAYSGSSAASAATGGAASGAAGGSGGGSSSAG